MIALFTDFGTRDAYVAQMKGAIVCINPQVQLIDLNHEVGQFDLRAAAYLLEASARYFPAGTIFVAVVDPGVGSSRRPLLIHTQADKFYIGPDNGLFTRVLEGEGLRAAYILTQPAYFREPQVSATFHGRDIFGPVAAYLTLGVSPARLGSSIAEVITLPQTRPRLEDNTIVGEVLHIDHYGNVVTNITADLLGAFHFGQRLACTVGGTTYPIPFVRTYAEGAPDELIGLINSDNAFELAISRGHASTSVEVQVGDSLGLRGEVEGRGDSIV